MVDNSVGVHFGRSRIFGIALARAERLEIVVLTSFNVGHWVHLYMKARDSAVCRNPILA